MQSLSATACVHSYSDVLNGRLNRWETIMALLIVDHALTFDDGELTSSLRVRRKAVESRYRPLSDSMCDGQRRG